MRKPPLTAGQIPRAGENGFHCLRAPTEDRALDGIAIALKGAQMGEEGYFGRAPGAVC